VVAGVLATLVTLIYIGLSYYSLPLEERFFNEGHVALNSGETLAQNIAEVSMTWRIIRKLAFTLYYEGTFEKVNQFNRLYGQLNFRF